MFGAPRSVIASGSQVVPPPRRPLDPAGPVCLAGPGSGRPVASGEVRWWYENALGWPTVPGDPVRLMVGARFDVLDVPADAGRAALRHLGPGSPVALRGDRMRLLVAPGSAEELPGLLEWLEWGSLPLGLTAIGEGGLMEAPLLRGVEGGAPFRAESVPQGDGLVPCETSRAGGASPPGPGSSGGRPLPRGRDGSQGAAVWLRPPEPGCEVEASLPTLSAMGGGGDAPDLVRLVDTVATRCHRIRLRRACLQPPAMRAQGRW
ncbi:SCO3374 family protein [Streptomyces sp. NPDC006372]|uniref:SCO3374 family protein n=1 Tax=Streptomyces sp. NPDC006372 TaxID=3155599 RepID=UPI0033A07304